MGVLFDFKVLREGYFPKGNGVANLEIQPVKNILILMGLPKNRSKALYKASICSKKQISQKLALKFITTKINLIQKIL